MQKTCWLQIKGVDDDNRLVKLSLMMNSMSNNSLNVTVRGTGFYNSDVVSMVFLLVKCTN